MYNIRTNISRNKSRMVWLGISYNLTEDISEKRRRQVNYKARILTPRFTHNAYNCSISLKVKMRWQKLLISDANILIKIELKKRKNLGRFLAARRKKSYLCTPYENGI